MIEGQNIVCFGLAEWDSPLPTNQHWLCRRLAAKNRVLFVDTIGVRKPTTDLADMNRMAARMQRALRGPVVIGEQLWRLSPLGPPPASDGWRHAAALRVLRRSLNSALKSLRFTSPVAWVFNPRFEMLIADAGAPADTASGVRFGSRIYHAVDDLTQIPGVDAEELLAIEERMARKSNHVFATSPAVFERLKAWAPERVHYLPNVADFAHFQRADDPNLKEPPPMTAALHPRIVFAGNIVEYKIDIKMLREAVAQRPNWSWVFIGPEWEGNREIAFLGLKSAPNTHFLGRVPYEELPTWLAAADALIIPYRLTESAQGVSPLKFFESLATGKPVAATALPSLLPYEKDVPLARDTAEFLEIIKTGLKEQGGAARQRRMELAKQYTWDRRMKELDELLEL